ncbi:uncharacterized protein isoform X1 [Takifugu rubripes]|uniref:uncharacterized protein isoform X1 n=1 Tax=Takifugu rubripes TaxID=31033 RepID=UPI001145FFF3|nr:uncharacterized protein LOC105418606 isoform X1 [Takifugu rubripes]XP_029685522.1 uncharacterized protein LOC105418606 isoform X1 [Takifugu rubripes]XP_029685523.1 uncharacterized protein LOC105418606 isoform X1 [Takifugu rubripes]
MKPQEAELVGEIAKLQYMVSELKRGFTSALLELSHIQHGDTHLREELEENRRSCQKKAARLELLVDSLREELGVLQTQIFQLDSKRQRALQDGDTSKHRESSNPADAPPSCGSRGKLLLHCFLQGLKAGLSEGTDARHQVAMQLLHAEWEYVSTLNQLLDKYKTPAAQQGALEPHQTLVKFVEELLQRHLPFRNSLQERLSAAHWKSLVGDILVQLIGQNDTVFSDTYVGYTTTLASFLCLEFNRLNHPDSNSDKVQEDREEMNLLSLLLAPVSRIHAYLSHVQSLLQWTGKEHPDCSLLLGAERALRNVLSRCHAILEEDVRWEEAEGAGQSCSEAAGSSASCCGRNHEKRESPQEAAALRNDPPVADLTNGCQSMRLECWSCSPVRRKGCGRDRSVQNRPGRDCCRACCSLLMPDAAGWGENSDSGQGTFSQHTGKGTIGPEATGATCSPEDVETDLDDTSAFGDSSVTSCSPDGTLCREEVISGQEEEEEEEEDSQVPVLLRPSYSQQREGSRERSVCLRWQIPRVTPHPPLRNAAGPPCTTAATPCLVSSRGKRLVSIRTGSPPLHPKSAFRPIWDDPSRQDDSAPEKDVRKGFVPVQAAARQSLGLGRDNLRPSLRRAHAAAVSGPGLWEDSEDSEGPCSTV